MTDGESKLPNADSSQAASSTEQTSPPTKEQTKDQIVAQIAYMWVGPTISFAVIIGFFFMLYTLLNPGSTTWTNIGDVKDVLFTLLGALGAAFTQVVNYWLGSSKGSADKTNLLKTGT